jgi:UDP-glucuronate 4-epimerase
MRKVRENQNLKVLITGAAGFIGYHLSEALLARGDVVFGLDNINDYYDVNLKYARLENVGIAKDEIVLNKYTQSQVFSSYKFIKTDMTDWDEIQKIFSEDEFDVVVNLAAQAGVRYSITNPKAYIDSNISGYLNILEACRYFKIKHFVYASSSSVYGINQKQPFSESDHTDHPIALYAATKKANEMMAHSYSHLYGLPTTGLRFFTVYGPWGRPDMALYIFTKNILNNVNIPVNNHGDMKRDFTYIDDIVAGILRVIDKPAMPSEDYNPLNPNPAVSSAPYRVFNIGRGKPEKLMDYISAIEDKLGKKAEINYLPMQDGDVPESFADTTTLHREFGYTPSVSIKEGISKFVEWYQKYTLK